ncbi:MAG: hypothetical protein AAGE52_04500 [Myxococcota bacterium]
MSTLLLRLHRPIHCRGDRFRARLRHLAKAERQDPSALLGRFAFRCDERAFAETLLTRATQWWLFRSDQALGCGDFVLVDMSSPDPRRRRVVALELKLRAGRSAGWQLRNSDSVLDSLHAVVRNGSVERLTASREDALAHLGVN